MKHLLRHACAAWICLGAAGVQADPLLANGYAALVNDKVITYEQVRLAVRERDLEEARTLYRRQPEALEAEIIRLRNEALRSLIEGELILHEFDTAGYKAPENVIEEQIKDRIREEYGDRSRLVRTLQAQNMTFEAFRRRIRERFIIEAMTARNISSAILISPHKIETYYAANKQRFELKDRVRLRMISLWNRADRGKEATHKIALEIQAKLKSGAAFKDVTELSDDQYRRQGGERGWIERGSKDLREDLQELAFTLKPGEPSEVIEKEEGFYLMLVEEFQPAHTQTIGEVRDEIEATLRLRERERLREDWIQRLLKKSFVRTIPLK